MLRLAVIGAGPAGLAAAAALRAQLPGAALAVFEAHSAPGGTWAPTPDSPAYDSLSTNLPTSVMAFDDFDFGPDHGDRSFVHHSRVGRYLADYADFHNLAPFLRLSTPVVAATFDPHARTWDVDGEPFDHLVVASGHFTLPHIPDVPDWSTFRGTVVHSAEYRNADPFAGQRVLVVGAGPSATDIARELAESGTTEVVRLARSHSLAAVGVAHSIDADSILLCTGYRYSFPFLSDDTVVVTDTNVVHPVYDHVWHAELGHKLAFIGLPFKVVPFPLCAVQARWVASVLSGRVALPNARARWRAIERDTHCLREWDEYCARISALTGHAWDRARFRVYKSVMGEREDGRVQMGW